MRPLAEEVGINVRRRRLELGLTQQQLADECGFDRTTIGLIENGKSNVRLLTIEIIADVLKIKASELLETD